MANKRFSPKSPAQPTELEFEKQLVALAQTFGWKAAGFRAAGGGGQGWRTPVKYDGKGFPDLTLVHPEQGVVIFTELKRDKGSKTYPEQTEWGTWLKGAQGNDDPNLYYRLWKPKDWPEIVDLLSFGKASVSGGVGDGVHTKSGE